MKKVFIGIDFSKLKFDAAIYLLDTKEFVSHDAPSNRICPSLDVQKVDVV